MKSLILTILILFLILTTACYTRNKPITFSTSFGEIEKGCSMVGVMGVLGNPHRIIFSAKREIWYYYFGDNQELFVYFINNKVIKVKEKKPITNPKPEQSSVQDK